MSDTDTLGLRNQGDRNLWDEPDPRIKWALDLFDDQVRREIQANLRASFSTYCFCKICCLQTFCLLKQLQQRQCRMLVAYSRPCVNFFFLNCLCSRSKSPSCYLIFFQGFEDVHVMKKWYGPSIMGGIFVGGSILRNVLYSRPVR